ncbi:MAG: AraC family transcriptional regulator [Bacteroidia bacterium]
MEIYNLPQDIFKDKKSMGDIIFHDYAAAVGSFKGKSILHTHAISLVIEGEKTMHFSERTVVIKNDEFHFLSSSNCIATMKLSDKQVFRSILIFFNDKVLSDFYLKYATLIKNIKGKQKIKNEPYLSFKKDAFILHYIESLKLLFQSRLEISNEMKLLKFEELMLNLLEKYPEKLLSFQVSKNKEFDDLEIKKAVETNLTNNISIDELAFLCNISLSTFKRRFVKIYGTSPNKWIVQKRMQIAKDLLHHYKEKPSEVYYKVGYENHSSFSQSFKQTFGITPKEFQIQHLTVKR